MCIGYIGDPSFLNTVHKVVLELKQLNPQLIYGIYIYNNISTYYKYLFSM